MYRLTGRAHRGIAQVTVNVFTGVYFSACRYKYCCSSKAGQKRVGGWGWMDESRETERWTDARERAYGELWMSIRSP